MAVFFLAQAAARQMKQQESGGAMLFTSSVTGHQAHKNLAAYGMTKAALEMLARNLVIELSQYKINVNTIAPGATLTKRTLEEDNDWRFEDMPKIFAEIGTPALDPLCEYLDRPNPDVWALISAASSLTNASSRSLSSPLNWKLQ